MDKSGNKTEGDARTATRTRLQRYTFLMACGLAPKGMETATTTAGADAVTIEKPKDFDLWSQDIEAAAAKGSAELVALWGNTPEDLRTYVIVGKKSWWDDCKAKASKVTKAKTAGGAQ